MSNNKQNTKKYARINFDEWASLASNDPEGFEVRRQDCIDQFIERYPLARQKRLRGMQFRIDMERKRAKTPLGACIKISSMMWDAVTGDKGLVSTVKLLINHESNGCFQGSTRNMGSQTATILPFVRQHDLKKTRH